MKRENGSIFGSRFVFLLTIAIGILFPLGVFGNETFEEAVVQPLNQKSKLKIEKGLKKQFCFLKNMLISMILTGECLLHWPTRSQ